MLKLSIPTLPSGARCLGQVPFGVQELAVSGEEKVCQQWVALLRSPAYAAHPFPGRPFVSERRFIPHIDQGERVFRFWINGGEKCRRLELVDREALVHNQPPMVLSMSPAAEGTPAGTALEIHGPGVQLAALKPREDGRPGWALRLHETTGLARVVRVEVPSLGIRQQVSFGGFEVKTLLLDVSPRALTETGLMEEGAPAPGPPGR